MFDSTQPAQQTGPQQQVLRGPIKSSERLTIGPTPNHWEQCFSLNNWISHWCKVSSFHRTLWCKIHWMLQAQIMIRFYIIVHRLFCIQGWKPHLWQAKCKTRVSILLIFRYSVLFWFSVNCFCVVWKFSVCCFTVISGFSSLYRKSTSRYTSNSKLFLNVDEEPPCCGQWASFNYVSHPG